MHNTVLFAIPSSRQPMVVHVHVHVHFVSVRSPRTQQEAVSAVTEVSGEEGGERLPHKLVSRVANRIFLTCHSMRSLVSITVRITSYTAAV